ncbi:MAG: hypothetical protein LQ341_003807, partial [Variospora aurantia]
MKAKTVSDNPALVVVNILQFLDGGCVYEAAERTRVKRSYDSGTLLPGALEGGYADRGY